jgi:EmrB/QacA subfamily drug resistance transporter
VFLSGVAVFATGSAICSIAPALGVLVAGRAVQGAGAAFMAPASLGLLLAAFPPERRTQIVAMWGGVGALGVASGPSLGALVISATDWRAAFWINLPICAALLLVGASVLAETPRVPTVRRPDYMGASLITIALASVALGLSQSDTWGWFSAKTLGSLAIGGGLVLVFVARQRVHPEPVLDLTLFESTSFRVANLAGVAFFVGFAALGLNNVLFLRQVWGYSVLHAGLLSALAPLTVAVLAPVSGRLASRHGFRPFAVSGGVLVAVAMLLNRATLSTTPEPLTLVLYGEIAAIGIAAFIPVNAAAAVSDLPPPRLSIGGAVNNTSRQVGSVLGVSLLVALIGSGSEPAALLAGHRRGWLLIAVTSAITAVIGVAQARRGAVVAAAAVDGRVEAAVSPAAASLP